MAPASSSLATCSRCVEIFRLATLDRCGNVHDDDVPRVVARGVGEVHENDNDRPQAEQLVVSERAESVGAHDAVQTKVARLEVFRVQRSELYTCALLCSSECVRESHTMLKSVQSGTWS